MARKVTKKTLAARSGKFLWLGNAPALDFVNTHIARQGQLVDLLADPDDLVLWLRESGLLAATPRMPDTLLERALRVARDYRALLRSGLESLADSRRLPGTVFAATNSLLARPSGHDALVLDGKGMIVERRWQIKSAEDLSAPIARSFAEFISAADLSRIRRCGNPECVLFFYDVSKSGTRAWCSLDICGNKLRVARFRERQAGS